VPDDDEGPLGPAYRARVIRDRTAEARPRRDLTPTPAALTRLAGRLTARDRWLAWMLAEHRVLTTMQITQLAYGTHRQATARLLTLHRLGVLDRFRPYTATGSAPLHYTLATLGAQVLAADHDTTPDTLDHHPERLARLAVSTQLAHAVGANSVFTALAAHARSSAGHGQLTVWWSERRCRTAWDGLVRPDGYGRWRHTADSSEQVETDFMIEYDLDSEGLDRVVAKLPGYAHLAAITGLTTPVLFWLPTPRRETRLHQAITAWQHRKPHHVGLVLATTNATTADTLGPAGPVWLPVPTPPAVSQARVTLAGLAPTRVPRPDPTRHRDQDTERAHRPQPAGPTAGLDAPDPRAPNVTRAGQVRWVGSGG
jgi:hypothetical protein